MKREKQPSAKRGRQSSRKKPSAADFLSSPPPPPPQKPPQKTAAAEETPKCFKFNVNSSPPETNSAAGSFRRKSASATVRTPPFRQLETVSSMAELKELASSRLESIKRQTERSHADILKDVESSTSRLHKRLKIQTQACQKLTDEIDKEFKKMLERISESSEAMKESYAQFQGEAQTSHSRVCRTSIPEKAQHFENTLNALRSRYVTS